MPIRIHRRPGRASGFTLFEVLLASAIAMILLFGAIYSTGETLGVVREGDQRVHTHIQARRALDRLLKDCRYSAALDVQGDPDNGWTLTIATTGSLDPPTLTYTWSPDGDRLLVSDGSESATILDGLTDFSITTETVPGGSGPVISRISMEWTVVTDPGLEAGAGGKQGTLFIGGSTWVRQHAPSF